MENTQPTNKKQDKIYTLIGGLVVAGVLIWLGSGIFDRENTSSNDNMPGESVAVEELNPDEKTRQEESPKGQNTTNPETDIRRAIMVDTVSKWNDVGEFSLQIEENSEKQYVGNRVVNIRANYNGSSSNLEDTLVSYCNKIATAIDLTGHSVAELGIIWTVPAESVAPLGECHYHSNEGILIYDAESNGILTQK